MEDSPWLSQRDEIKKVVIKDGVTSIGNNAFSYCSGLTSVTIPNSVTSIGDQAFDSCSGLTSLTIPNSVTSIGDYAFYGTKWYDNQPDGVVYAGKVLYAYKGTMPSNTKIDIKEGTTEIASRAFRNCSGLTSLTIPNSVTSIGGGAFSDCKALTSITIPNSVTSIGSSAFYNCKALTSITIPNSVTSIGGWAFSGCSGLTSVTIPNSVTSIGGSAFSGCSGLTSVTIPNSVTSIESSAFSGCSGLTSLSIPNSVTSIVERAFQNCSGLTSLTIPNSVTWIEESAFSGCSGLTSLTIPNSVTGIGWSAFSGCSGLTSVTIPNSVTSIGYSAFSGCSGLTSLTIPNSVTSIGKLAFYDCSALTSITIPNSVTSIGWAAFGGTKWSDNQPDGVVYAGKVLYAYKGTMPSNTKINIKEGTTGITGNAFRDCSGLTSVTIPNSVTSIGTYAFSGCSGLTSVICMASTPPYIERPSKGLTQPFPESTAFYVPSRYVAQYRNAYHWDNGPLGWTSIYVQAIPTTYTLTDGETFNNGLQLDECEISYTRTFNNTAWQALYIPFSLNYNDWKDNFEIAYINGVRQLDKNDDGIIDETIMDVIKIKSGSTTPNMPYLIKAKTTGEKTFSVTNATIYPAEENSIDCSTTIAKYTFTGTYNSISSATMIANNYYGMGGGELVQSDGSNDLKPYRWYMKVESRNPSYNASNAAKTITINVIDDEEEMTTGIRQLQITNDELPVYDLNGRKVNENNLKPGIYVKNGKKFVVK